jgi:ribonuclease Z
MRTLPPQRATTSCSTSRCSACAPPSSTTRCRCSRFAIDEKAQVRVAADRIAARGLATGPWLRTLKDAVLAGTADDAPIDVAWRDRTGAHAERHTVGALRPLVSTPCRDGVSAM